LKTETNSYVWPESIVSRIDNFDARLVGLEKLLVDAVGKMDDTVRATIRDSVSLLRSIQKGEIQETDYPANARLEMCEALLDEKRTLGEVIVPLSRKSDVWLSLAKGRSSVPVRLRAPAENKGPMPVLFLFHGAGGSENMFFETYGAGRVVDEGLKRGWLVVAPRQGLLGLSLDVEEILDVLGQSFEIDRSQVMLMGHSMGAGQVVRQASLHPDLPIAAVALGGGNRVSDAAKLKSITWFVGAGSEDFGKAGAKQLNMNLGASGVTSTYHEYVNVEHMVIVQAAINDVFQFLDDTILNKMAPVR
jgi:predicted esterase